MLQAASGCFRALQVIRSHIWTPEDASGCEKNLINNAKNT